MLTGLSAEEHRRVDDPRRLRGKVRVYAWCLGGHVEVRERGYDGRIGYSVYSPGVEFVSHLGILHLLLNSLPANLGVPVGLLGPI